MLMQFCLQENIVIVSIFFADLQDVFQHGRSWKVKLIINGMYSADTGY